MLLRRALSQMRATDKTMPWRTVLFKLPAHTGNGVVVSVSLKKPTSWLCRLFVSQVHRIVSTRFTLVGSDPITNYVIGRNNSSFPTIGPSPIGAL